MGNSKTARPFIFPSGVFKSAKFFFIPMAYNHKTNAEQVADDFASEAKGKHVVVTGGNSGLGKETCRVLAKHGAHVTLLSRSIENGENAKADILLSNPGVDITVMSVDLGNMASIRKFAQEYIATEKPIDILINNAGIMAGPLEKTKDGFESQFGVNHLGHFLLTNLLLPVLIKSGTKAHSSRVVNLSSIAALLFAPAKGILFDDLDASKNYQKWERYGQSKIANILFTNELNKRMKEQGHDVISVSLHPGNIAETNLGRSINLHSVAALLWQIKKSCIHMLTESKNTKQGTATTILCALDPNVQSDRYYEDCNVSDRVHPVAFDKDIAARLWNVSASMVGL